MGIADDVAGPKAGRPAAARRFRWRLLWRIAPVAVLAAGLVAFALLAPDQQSVFQLLKDHRAALTAWTAQNPVLAVLSYILLYALVAAFSLPVSAFVTLFGGFLFGAMLGTAAVVIGATAGAVALFLAVRAAFADLVRARFGRRLARMERGFAENAFSYMLFLRLVPVFPFFLVNIAPAFFGVRAGAFALATFIGIIPGTFVYANVGASLGRVLDGAERLTLDGVLTLDIILALGLLALLALVPVAYGKLRRRRLPPPGSAEGGGAEGGRAEGDGGAG